MSLDEASRAQVEAADPGASTWLSANAGSGKTRVLTDRVARLLLDEVPPERILCLTYTKAAASEMQNRLFKRLGEWAMLGDGALTSELVKLGVEKGRLAPELLRRARTLFARAIETPGGLKIQTIHSFCSAVLRRFPLEAGVSPGFAEMDERAQKDLALEVADALAGDGGAGQAATDAAARHVSDDDLWPILSAILSARDGLDPPAGTAEIFDWFGIAPDLTEAEILRATFLGGEQALCDRLVPGLNPKFSPHMSAVKVLPTFPWASPTIEDLADVEAALLSGSDTKTPDAPKPQILGNKNVAAAMGPDLEPLEAFMRRLEAARPLRRGLLTARKTDALHRFAAQFLPAYDAAKAARGWLDFDDLIRLTRELLTAPGVAQWVLFRLDGGIDHILVDEAQDTSPAQWQIIAKLAEEFAAGLGARGNVMRTIFVVGDKKQSIYSFQGADPEGFDRMRDHFKARLTEIAARFETLELVYSFRSAYPILALVDRVAGGIAGAGVGQDVHHIAFFDTKPGRVDVWPVVPKAEKTEPANWDDPVDLLAEQHHHVILANRVADFISATLSDGTTILDEDEGRRPVRPGDFLILVQRRSALFHEIIAAIKKRGLPIAGADRMRVAAELAVRDLIALLSFLATPEDDLSLAIVLRSPLFGWSDAQLFDLAHGRKGYLWRALQGRGAEFPEVVPVLEDLRNRADFLRPYDLLERALIRHDGRRRLLARLGNEAEDGIDAMLAQALAYEQRAVPSLTGFVGWLQADDVTIKRSPASAGNQIRVMSIHGAKGLESPIVILPDTKKPGGKPQGQTLLAPEDGPLAWPIAKSDSPADLGPAWDDRARREEEERNRLLYVAMTRAKDWLVVAAAGDLGREEAGNWYKLIAAGAAELGARPWRFEGGEGLRLETGDWPLWPGKAEGAETPEPGTALPDWATRPAPEAPRDAAALSPSDLGGAKALPGEAEGLAEEAAKRRGRLVHLLLEHLPSIAAPGWPAAAPGILALDGGAEPGETAALLAEATAVLTRPDLAHLFAPETLAEVELTAHSAALNRQVLGVIDRLIVTQEAVLAVDFKSNAVVPEAAEDVPEGLLRQMGAYAEMLAALYPGRRIETAILWTRTAGLMPLPHALVMAALQRAAGA